MKKLVVKLDLPDDKAKQKALKTVSTLQGIDFISIDMKEKKMTVIGTVDPVSVVTKLRKYWQSNILTVGPAKEPELPKNEDQPPAKKLDEEPNKESEATAKQEEDPPKDEEPKKEEQKPTLEEPKMEQGKEKKKNDQEEEECKKLQVPPQPDPVLEMVRSYRAYNPHMNTYYYAQSMEENPNACLIS